MRGPGLESPQAVFLTKDVEKNEAKMLKLDVDFVHRNVALEMHYVSG
jgi:hypothetical protein